MTGEQWRAAWVLCETAGNLDGEAQRDYVRGATVDAEVERRVIAVYEQLDHEPLYPPAPTRGRYGWPLHANRAQVRVGWEK